MKAPAEAFSSPFPFQLTRSVTLPFLATPALPLSSLPGAFHNTGAWQNQMAYYQSGAMVSWLEEQHPGALRHTLDKMAQGKPFALAMQQTSGLTPAAWFNRWRANDRLAERHGRYLLFALLALWLLKSLVGFFLRRRRFRRALQMHGKSATIA